MKTVVWVSILILSSCMVASAASPADQEIGLVKLSAGPVTISPRADGVAVLVDTTGSVDAQMPQGGSRRARYLDLLRGIIRATHQAGIPLTVARLCGITEVLFGPVLVSRSAFADLRAMIETALSSCAPTSTVVSSSRRGAGTDLVKGLEWLAQPDNGTLRALISDGIHQPPHGGGKILQVEFHAALDRLAPQVRDELWILGTDEGVRREIAARVPHVYGLFDLTPALKQLGGEIERKRR